MNLRHISCVIGLVFLCAANNAVAGGNNLSTGHELHLRAYFERFAGPQAPDFGDQFTLSGSLAPFDDPNEVIGNFVLHFVATAQFATEGLLYGVLNLPDGQISIAGLTPTQPPRTPGPITGGTGAYRKARGELEHQTHEGGVEEFILTFE